MSYDTFSQLIARSHKTRPGLLCRQWVSSFGRTARGAPPCPPSGSTSRAPHRQTELGRRNAGLPGLGRNSVADPAGSPLRAVRPRSRDGYPARRRQPDARGVTGVRRLRRGGDTAFGRQNCPEGDSRRDSRRDTRRLRRAVSHRKVKSLRPCAPGPHPALAGRRGRRTCACRPRTPRQVGPTRVRALSGRRSDYRIRARPAPGTVSDSQEQPDVCISGAMDFLQEDAGREIAGEIAALVERT